MSHSVVLITGLDIEAQLAPFDENIEVPEYRKTIDLFNNDWFVNVANEHFGNAPGTSLTPAQIVEGYNAKYGDNLKLDESGESAYELSTYNPQSKWDWYQVGGRWTGYFKTKPGVEAQLGDASMVGGNVAEPGTADIIRKGDIDIEGMERLVADDAQKRWQKIHHTIINGRDWDTWATVLARHPGDTEAARIEYWAQAVLVDWKKDRDNPFAELDDYKASLSGFIETRVRDVLVPFSFLHEGTWHQRGRMGWFGLVSGESDTWPETFRALFDALPDDTWLTAVDVHI